MGVDYLDETVESLQIELLALDPGALSELDRETVQSLLPAGAAATVSTVRCGICRPNRLRRISGSRALL